MNYEMLECLKCVTNCSRAQTKLSTNRRNHFSLVFFVQFLCISNPCHSQNHFQYFIQFHRFVVFCLQISVCMCVSLSKNHQWMCNFNWFKMRWFWRQMLCFKCFFFHFISKSFVVKCRYFYETKISKRRPHAEPFKVVRILFSCPVLCFLHFINRFLSLSFSLLLSNPFRLFVCAERNKNRFNVETIPILNKSFVYNLWIEWNSFCLSIENNKFYVKCKTERLAATQVV